MNMTTMAGMDRYSAAHLYCGDALECCQKWPAPTAIIVDGPYGVNGFPGDLKCVDLLPDWYAPHIAAWSSAAITNTTLWFWGTELGWATVHPLLQSNGWDYREAHIWDKDLSHIAGNVNSKTIRSTPVVTEICVRYTRKAMLSTPDGAIVPLKEWLRAEWRRSGLPFKKANEVCGVKDMVSRKYFAKDNVWCFPPADTMKKLSDYANAYGKETPVPYFSLDGKTPFNPDLWPGVRAKWNHIHGVTNVWHVPALHGAERLKDSKGRAIHNNQKPKEIINYLIQSSTDPGDIVWDPYAGLATTAVCCLESGRTCYCSEVSADVYNKSVERLKTFS